MKSKRFKYLFSRILGTPTEKAYVYVYAPTAHRYRYHTQKPLPAPIAQFTVPFPDQLPPSPIVSSPPVPYLTFLFPSHHHHHHHPKSKEAGHIHFTIRKDPCSTTLLSFDNLSLSSLARCVFPKSPAGYSRIRGPRLARSLLSLPHSPSFLVGLPSFLHILSVFLYHDFRSVRAILILRSHRAHACLFFIRQVAESRNQLNLRGQGEASKKGGHV